MNDGCRTGLGNKSSFINDIFVIYDFINDIFPSAAMEPLLLAKVSRIRKDESGDGRRQFGPENRSV